VTDGIQLPMTFTGATENYTNNITIDPCFITATNDIGIGTSTTSDDILTLSYERTSQFAMIYLNDLTTN
jgi:hypothetical protein